MPNVWSRLAPTFLATHLRLGSLTTAGFAKRHDPAVVARLNESIAAIAAKVEIGSDIVGRHPGVNALGLQNLLEAFRVMKETRRTSCRPLSIATTAMTAL